MGGPYLQHQLARIYILVGEPEKALDQLEPLLKIPYVLSPGLAADRPQLRSAARKSAVSEARRRREVIGPETAAELARLAGSPGRGGTQVRLLRDGEEAFPAMVEAIASARRCVLFENFIFAGDATGRRFAEALSAAASRGVEVRVLYDPIGTMMVRGGSVATVLRKAGVTARPFLPLSPFAPWSWLRMCHRDHRKSLTVDGETAVVGGLCISDNWSPSEKGGSGWRDTALLVRGTIASDVERAFEAMWRRAQGGASTEAPTPAFVDDPPVAILAEDLPETERVAAIYEWLAARARSTLEITDAYMVAPPQVLAAFEAAARRGVAVSILLPGRNNHPLAGAAARRVYQRLLDAGVRIYEWEGVMIHAKTAVADGEVALVGSSNLDPLSMRRNYELNLVVIDSATGAGMRAMFARDLERACRVEPAGWRLRPRWQKAAERAAGLARRGSLTGARAPPVRDRGRRVSGRPRARGTGRPPRGSPSSPSIPRSWPGWPRRGPSPDS